MRNMIDLRGSDKTDGTPDAWAMFRPENDGWSAEVNIIEGGQRITLSRAEFETLANAYSAWRAKFLK